MTVRRRDLLQDAWTLLLAQPSLERTVLFCTLYEYIYVSRALFLFYRVLLVNM